MDKKTKNKLIESMEQAKKNMLKEEEGINTKESKWYLAIDYDVGRYFVKQRGNEMILVNENTFEYEDTISAEKAKELGLKITGRASKGEIEKIKEKNPDIG